MTMMGGRAVDGGSMTVSGEAGDRMMMTMMTTMVDDDDDDHVR